MMCYKDMCFCPFYEACKKGDNCFRALTKEHFERAAKMKLPVSRYADKPQCFQGK